MEQPTQSSSCGIAVDLGTTTLGFALVDLDTGRVLKSCSRLNSQRRYGKDVLRRVQQAGAGKLEALCRTIRQDLLEGIQTLAPFPEIRDVRKVAVTGNTVMIHLLLNQDPSSLGRYPYTPVTHGDIQISSRELWAVSQPNCPVDILPVSGAFIGADVLAGLYSLNGHHRDETILLVDIGTNGEMVLGNRTDWLATSAAAGPAFEGGGISCGTGGISGAIASVRAERGILRWETIDQQDPVGLCGSGLIDLVAEGLRYGWIDVRGGLTPAAGTEGTLTLTQRKDGRPLRVTRQDLREIQLAVSALRTGIECLLREKKIVPAQVERVFLAGGFGAKIQPANAVRIGLLPKEWNDRVVSAGNTSLSGGIRYLLDPSASAVLREMAGRIRELGLAENEAFQDYFLHYLEFPDS